jgi:hypothetical protein
MTHRPTDLERAFQLARSGRCGRVEDLRRQLRKEGYSVDRLTGRTLVKQLQALIEAATHSGNGPRPFVPPDEGSRPLPQSQSESQSVGLAKAGFPREPAPDSDRGQE